MSEVDSLLSFFLVWAESSEGHPDLGRFAVVLRSLHLDIIGRTDV